MRLGARGKAFNLLAQLKAAPVWAICDPHSFNYLFPPLPLALLPVLDHQTCTIIRNVVGPIGKLANANLSLILLIYIQSPATTKDCDCKHWNLPFHCPYWHHHCSCRKNILLQKKEIKGGKEKDVLAEKKHIHTNINIWSRSEFQRLDTYLNFYLYLRWSEMRVRIPKCCHRKSPAAQFSDLQINLSSWHTITFFSMINTITIFSMIKTITICSW